MFHFRWIGKSQWSALPLEDLIPPGGAGTWLIEGALSNEPSARFARLDVAFTSFEDQISTRNGPREGNCNSMRFTRTKCTDWLLQPKRECFNQEPAGFGSFNFTAGQQEMRIDKKGKAPALTEAGPLSSAEQLEYIADLLAELKAMAVGPGCDTLVGLLELSQAEARRRAGTLRNGLSA